MRAFVFPGQGSQAVGMGKSLAEAFTSARLVFEEVDEALGQKLSKLMFEGPESDLTLTENAQPALMAVSLAVLRVLETEGNFRLADKASFVAGHSLGEYSALAAAGAFTLADTARLLKLRGQAMQKAVPVGEGAMAALLNFDLERAQKVAAQASFIEIEVETLAQLEEALAAGATMVLLDNMDLATLHQAVRINNGRAILEISGGVTLDGLRTLAETGVDRISIGGLTKDIKATDFSMRLKDI